MNNEISSLQRALVEPQEVTGYLNLVWNILGCVAIPAREVVKDGRRALRVVGKYKCLADAWRSPQNFEGLWRERMQMLGADPLAAVAVLLSPRIAALDIDKHHAGPDGWAALESCQKAYGALPETFAQTSRSGGGKHYLLRIPGQSPLTTVHGIFPGIDFLRVHANGTPTLLYFRPGSLGGHSRVISSTIASMPQAWLVGLLAAHAQNLNGKRVRKSDPVSQHGTAPIRQKPASLAACARGVQSTGAIAAPRMSPGDMAVLKYTLRHDFNRIHLANIYAHSSPVVRAAMMGSRQNCLWCILRLMCAQAFQLRDGVIDDADYREALQVVVAMAHEHAWKAHPDPRKRNDTDFPLSHAWTILSCQLRDLREHGVLYARRIVRRDWNSIRLHCDAEERARRSAAGRRRSLLASLEAKVSAGLIRLGARIEGVKHLQQGCVFMITTHNTTYTMQSRVQGGNPAQLLAACVISRRYNRFFTLKRVDESSYRLTLWMPNKGQPDVCPEQDAAQEYTPAAALRQLELPLVFPSSDVPPVLAQAPCPAADALSHDMDFAVADSRTHAVSPDDARVGCADAASRYEVAECSPLLPEGVGAHVDPIPSVLPDGPLESALAMYGFEEALW